MITILRQTCPFLRFEEINPALIDVKVETDGFIEAQTNEAHVDFANNFIGGGVLTHGTVQVFHFVIYFYYVHGLGRNSLYYCTGDVNFVFDL